MNFANRIVNRNIKVGDVYRGIMNDIEIKIIDISGKVVTYDMKGGRRQKISLDLLKRMLLKKVH